jgi:lipopolysaccharide export system protein LptA
VRWQRAARLLVAIVGIGCAVALFRYSRSRPPQVTAPPQVAVDPAATIQVGRGRTIRLRGDKDVGTIDYESSKTYADGHVMFEKPHIVSTDERGFEAWADRTETKGTSVHADNPGLMELTGHVKVHTKDGLELLTDAATYNDTTGGVSAPGAVTFKRGRMSGRGVGAVYDRAQDLLTIVDQAHVDVAPGDDGKGAMSANSKTLMLDRVHKYSRLDGAATITHEAETLVGDTAALYWTDDEKSLKLLELRGHSAVTQAPNAAAGSPPDMHADDIDLTFYPDGHTVHLAALTGRTAPASLELIDQSGRRSVSGSTVTTAVAPDGSTVTNLEATKPVKVVLPKTADNPARTITAQALQAQGTEKEGLKQARFTGGTEFTEIVPGTNGAKDSVRTGRSRVLVLALNGAIDAIDRATFTQDATFTDGDVHGDADESDYFAADGKLVLKPAASGTKKTPRVTDGNLQVDAQLININVNTHDLDASGDVKTVNRPAATDTKPAQKSALFDFNDPTHPVYGAGATLHYTSDSGRAAYTGTKDAQAQTWQEQGAGQKNSVSGDEVTIETDTHNLQAKGRVVSTYFLQPQDAPGTPQSPPAKPTKYLGTADTLDYKDADRLATYLGAPARLDSVDGTTTAPHIDVIFNPDGNAVDKLDAIGGAYSDMTGGREAVAQRLTYVAATDTYTLYGSTATPARVKLPNNDHTECTKSTGEKLTFTKQSGSADGSRQNDKLASCSVSIKDPIK